jgi:hypothetical protein
MLFKFCDNYTARRKKISKLAILIFLVIEGSHSLTIVFIKKNYFSSYKNLRFTKHSSYGNKYS